MTTTNYKFKLTQEERDAWYLLYDTKGNAQIVERTRYYMKYGSLEEFREMLREIYDQSTDGQIDEMVILFGKERIDAVVKAVESIKKNTVASEVYNMTSNRL